MALNISDLFGQSLSALSLSSPTAVAGLATAGGALAIVATSALATGTHKEWSDYKESQYKEKVDEANKLYKKHLERIESPNGAVLSGFPPIFKFGKDSKTVDSLHYTPDEIEELGTEPPHIEAALASYREDILDAIRGLKAYYKSRDSDKYNDVTSGVISYLLNMLQNKCLSFEGYNNDIAYLDAVARFIDDYASKKGSTKTQHFSRLGPVYKSLIDAKQKLERHQKSLPLRELINDLRETTLTNSDRMLRLFVKIMTPSKNAYLGDLVTYNQLLDGILRSKYIRSESGGKFVWSWDSEVDLPKCMFRSWIIRLANYYKLSLTPERLLLEENAFNPNEFYHFAQWAQQIIQQKDPLKEDRTRLNNELDAIRSVFKQAPNFINTKLRASKKSFEFVTVTEDHEILERIQFIADFGHLIHTTISLQAFSAHLVGSIDQLGSIYINNPHHFKKIFAELENLCHLVQSDIDKNKENLMNLSIANNNRMRLAKEVLPDDINKVIETIELALKSLSVSIKNYRDQHIEPTANTLKETVTDMLGVARFFSKIYQVTESSTNTTHTLSIPLDIQESHSKSTNLINEVPEHTEPLELIPQSNTPHTLKKPELPLSDLLALGSKESDCFALDEPMKQIQSKPISKRDSDPDPYELIENSEDSILNQELMLSKLSHQIYKRLSVIKKELPVEQALAKYQQIYKALRVLQLKSIAMLCEEPADSIRVDKANKTYNLVLSLYQTTLDFLSLSREDRAQKTPEFIKLIHTELNKSENNAFIDNHRDIFSKFIYEHFGFFHTETRNKLSVLDHAYHELHMTSKIEI